MSKIQTICLFFTFFNFYAAAHSEWTRIYKQIFDCKKYTTKQIFIKNQHSSFLFSQLVFSWNAQRPPQGFFRFSVRVRTAQTQKWSRWHTMIEWGAHIQRSFHSKSKRGTKYNYVRLETGKHIADLFEIRVEACDGASLCFLKFTAITISNLKKFSSEHVTKEHRLLKSIIIQGVPRRSQIPFEKNGERVLCSPTSLSMLAEYLCKKPINLPLFAQNVYDNGLRIYGSWPFNTAHAYEKCDNKAYFYVTRLSSFKELHKLLLQRIPIVVSIRGFVRGAPKAYPSGHLLLVIGYDAHRQLVICHDPAQKQKRVLSRYTLTDFLAAWDRSYRLAYIASPIGSLL